MKKLRAYNSLTDKLDEINVTSELPLRFYVCGPTVYDDAHIGHARNYVTFDVIRRVLLRYYRQPIIFAMNITDIDDKIITAAGNGFAEHAKQYENRFFEDMKTLNVMMPDHVVRVSEHINDIVQYITEMKKYTYTLDDHPDGTDGMSVYFDITKFEEDGFTYNKFREFEPDPNNNCNACNGYSKKDKRDFVLWKKAKQNEPAWNSPWGKGRPGWHIECTTLASGLFSQIDVHGGGKDLIFPHHENEIAQAEAHNCSKDWVKHFLHIGHLHIDGKKMSKSLKNFITIREAMKKYTSRQLRLLFLRHPWDKPMDYVESEFELVFSFEKRLVECMASIKSRQHQRGTLAITDKLHEFDVLIRTAIFDNMRFNLVLDAIMELVSYINKNLDKIDYTQLLSAQDRMLDILGVMGIRFDVSDNNADTYIDYIVGLRETIRQLAIKNKSKELFEMTDKIRTDMLQRKIVIQDTKGQAKWFVKE